VEYVVCIGHEKSAITKSKMRKLSGKVMRGGGGRGHINRSSANSKCISGDAKPAVPVTHKFPIEGFGALFSAITHYFYPFYKNRYFFFSVEAINFMSMWT